MQYTKQELEEILQNDFFANPKVFTSGRRNDDAVDFSIICWCLGLDPFFEFGRLSVIRDWSSNQIDVNREHIERVYPYLYKWGAKGTMEAMVYSIDY